jgi:hypothetical protein
MTFKKMKSASLVETQLNASHNRQTLETRVIRKSIVLHSVNIVDASGCLCISY